MRYLAGGEAERALGILTEAAAVAREALCVRDMCGALVMSGDECIGRGYNAPPCDDLANQMCANEYGFTEKKKSDRTCCVHAEWRALLDAIRHNPQKVSGSRLYFMRLDLHGEMTRAGDPYCTVCSRLALDCGISEVILWHEEGIAVYSANELNTRSYQFLKR